MLPLAYGSAEVTRILRDISKGGQKAESNKRHGLRGSRGLMPMLESPAYREVYAVPITEAQVQELLKSVVDPTTGKDYISSKEIKKVQVSGDAVVVDVVLGYPAQSQIEPVKQQIQSALGALAGIGAV